MSTSTRPFSIVSFQDGSVVVVYSDPRKPRLLEVIAIFADAARARDYADRENSRSAEPASEPTEAPTRRSVELTAATPELSSRQSAVLGALRSRMDEHQQVQRKPPPSPKRHRFRSDLFTRFCNRWRRNSSSKPPGQAQHKHPPSTRSCDCFFGSAPAEACIPFSRN